MSAEDAIAVYQALEARGIQIWIDGGWGVDALLGAQTRRHSDLDIAIEEKDVPAARALLEERGYTELRRSSAWNFVLGDGTGHEVDFHSFVFEGEGHVVDGIQYPDGSLTGTGTIAGQAVRCIAPEHVVKIRTGHEIRERDIHDVSALCERFHIKLPQEYRRLGR